MSTAAPAKVVPRAWITAALALLAVADLAGCGTGTASPPPPAASTSVSEPSAASPTPMTPSSAGPAPATSAPKVDATVDVVVANGRVTPNAKNVRVSRGDRVRFTINSDVDESIHIHGYDITAEARPGKPGAVTFVADQSGVFEVETHESARLVVKLIVS
ncbi:MAG: cupredoxin domain-containing protein [Propionibacteriaceae bacterium]